MVDGGDRAARGDGDEITRDAAAGNDVVRNGVGVCARPERSVHGDPGGEERGAGEGECEGGGAGVAGGNREGYSGIVDARIGGSAVAGGTGQWGFRQFSRSD